MPDYRRAFQPGGTFFFTVVTAERVRFLATDRSVNLLDDAITATTARWPFNVEASVTLPDHLHTIWTLPKGDADFSTRWAFLKKTFTKAWIAEGGCESAVSESKAGDRRRGVWQRRFWEHMIRDEWDFERHCDYIHYNPVRHGLARCPHGWKASSFERFVREGFYASDWGCVCRGRSAHAPQFDDISETAVE